MRGKIKFLSLRNIGIPHLGFHSLTLKENFCTSLWRCFHFLSLRQPMKHFWTFWPTLDCLDWVMPLYNLTTTPHLLPAPLQVSSLWILPTPQTRYIPLCDITHMPVNSIIAFVLDTNHNSGHSCNNSMRCLEKNASLRKSAKTPILLVYCSSSPNLSLSSVSAPSMHCFTLLYITVCTISLPLLRMLIKHSHPHTNSQQDTRLQYPPRHCCRDPAHRASFGPFIHSPHLSSHLQLKHYSCFQTSCSLGCSAAAHK